MPSHTPGPWEEYSGGETIHSAGGSLICIVCPEGHTLDSADRANAHLIAAAPELVEALEAVLGTFSDATDDIHNHCDPIRMARQALAKAKGGD